MLDIGFRSARELPDVVPERPTIAMNRHESMEALTRPLGAPSLLPKMTSAEIHDFFIDQSSFCEDGV